MSTLLALVLVLLATAFPVATLAIGSGNNTDASPVSKAP